MTNNRFDVEQISILINTNIPNDNNKHYITKHIFMDYEASNAQKKNEEFPFFTSTVKFPKQILQKKTFNEKLNFFFNRKTFIDVLTNDVDYTELDIEDSKTLRDEITHYNIATIIELLFTTVYPIINDNKDSFNNLIAKKVTYKLSFDGTIPKFLKKIMPSMDVNFSYIKLNGKEYTVTSTCVVNDILNHSEYNKLIYKFHDFKKWKLHTVNEIELKLSRIKNQIRYEIENNFDDEKKIRHEIDRNTKNFNRYTYSYETEKMTRDLFKSFDEFRSTYNSHDMMKNILISIISRFKNNRSFQTLRSLIYEFLTIDIIKEKYFETNENYNDVSADVERYFQKNYSKYSIFFKELSKFVAPNRESTNYQLQMMINDFYKRKNDIFEKFMSYVYDKYINDKKNDTFVPQDMSIYGFSEDNFINSLYIGANFYDTQNNYETSIITS